MTPPKQVCLLKSIDADALFVQDKQPVFLHVDLIAGLNPFRQLNGNIQQGPEVKGAELAVGEIDELVVEHLKIPQVL